jgi:hypothetical protein
MNDDEREKYYERDRHIKKLDRKLERKKNERIQILYIYRHK